MRAVAASLAQERRAAGAALSSRRSVFPRPAAPGLDARFVLDTGAGVRGPRDEVRL